jgi:hypothetical protein
MLTVISGIFALSFLLRHGRTYSGHPRLSASNKTFRIKQDVDARHKAGHDALDE